MHAAVLRYFEAVAEEGSIRRASERIHISASAVNRQILKLEDQFGVPLFERHPEGMRLTEAGKLVLRHARNTLHEFGRLRGDIDNLVDVVSGGVTVATLDNPTVQFLPEAVAQFVALHPKAQVRVASCDSVEAMHSVCQGTADLGLTFSPVCHRGITVLKHVECPMCVVMRPDHELASRASVSLEECGAHRLIYQDPADAMQLSVGNEMEAFKRVHKPTAVSNTRAMVKHLLLEGVGISFSTKLEFSEALAEGSLIAVPLEGKRMSELRLCLVAPAQRLPTVAGNAMADHLQKALACFATANFTTTAATTEPDAGSGQ